MMALAISRGREWMSVRFFKVGNHTNVEIDGKVVEMGESFAKVDFGSCKIHGDDSPRIGGVNQGGHDGMYVCLLCCRQILEEIESPTESSEQIKAPK